MANMPLFVDAVPDYSIKDDHLHIQHRELEVVMPVRLVRLAIARCDAVLREHDRAHRIVEFPKPKRTKGEG